jgi:fructose-specific component phosphotransferase system IIB-like protein
MTVKELLELLEKVDDKDLPIRVLENNPNNPEFNMTNYWLYDIEVVDTGTSGYENCGEVILTGGE